jgi:ankyrin repeat protein
MNSRLSRNADPITAFLAAAVIPRDASHGSGTLEPAQAILVAHPEVATTNVHTAAALGDDVTVRRFLAADPASATTTGGPYGWDPLTHLCFSRYLRLDRVRSAGFVRAAEALLDAGASAHTGFHQPGHQPELTFESAIYGAAGVAHHAELTRLLLERGADPNDDETPYHAPESYDNGAMQVLVESGRLTADSLTTLLLRKSDWHDLKGIQWLLDHGADPNDTGRWGRPALPHALRSDNALAIIEALLDHGADPARPVAGITPAGMAAWAGRGDVLDLFERRGLPMALEGVERLLAACARNDAAGVRAFAAGKPGLLATIRDRGGELLARFAGIGNTAGVGHLLDLGVAVTALYREGNGYFDVAKDSMALHVAAWRGRHDTVRLLIDRGAPVNAPDGQGRTPLVLAVRACVDSYWSDRRSPESIRALLEAGALVQGIHLPTGYPEADELLGRSF